MWGATTPKLKKKCMKFFANTCQSRGVKYNGGGGGGRLQQRPWKFNNSMNIINIMNMLLKSIGLAAIGKIIKCMEKKVDPILHGPRAEGGGGMKTYVICK